MARVSGSWRRDLGLARRRIGAAATGASGRPLITWTLPGEYRAAAVPDGLKTTFKGAARESTARSAGVSAVSRKRWGWPSAASTRAESRRGATQAAVTE